MTDELGKEEKEKNRKTFELYKAELDKRELANTDNYDKNILTLSSAGLVTSLTLIKGITPYPIWTGFLYASWFCFGFAILTTISSFLVSNRAIRKQIDIAEKYYIENDDTAFDTVNHWSRCTSIINFASGIFFTSAIASIIFFGLLNFEGHSVTKTEQVVEQKCNVVGEGKSVKKLQQRDQKNVEKGSTIPPLPKKPENTQQPKKPSN